MNIVALIPAKSTSTRIPNKNIRLLAGHPLMAYSIAVAKETGVFIKIVVSTDSQEYMDVARQYGACPMLRLPKYAAPGSPDIQWVFDTMYRLWVDYHRPDAFMILRPTSPFRTAEMLHRAIAQFCNSTADSLRAVEKARQHPGKMWIVQDGMLLPVLPYTIGDTPWHSNQTQCLPEVYVQNASMEICNTLAMFDTHKITGRSIAPFYTHGHEGFDVNDEGDWREAERLIESGEAVLPNV